MNFNQSSCTLCANITGNEIVLLELLSYLPPISTALELFYPTFLEKQDPVTILKVLCNKTAYYTREGN